MILANDANKDRTKAVIGNLHRLGITNSVVCCQDGRNMPKVCTFNSSAFSALIHVFVSTTYNCY